MKPSAQLFSDVILAWEYSDKPIKADMSWMYYSAFPT